MDRRTFFASTAGAAAIAGLAPRAAAANLTDPDRDAPFTLDFAPHFGMFDETAGDGFVEQLEFMADEGFTAFEDNDIGMLTFGLKKLRSHYKFIGILFIVAVILYFFLILLGAFGLLLAS